MKAEPQSGRTAKRRSLRWQLLVPLNAALLIIVGLFLVIDVRSVWQTLLDERRASLDDEAESVLSAIIHMGAGPPATWQSYINEVSAKAQKTSPGHYIAAEIGLAIIQSGGTQTNPQRQLAAMRVGAKSSDRLAPAEGGTILVGSAQLGPFRVWVSEHLDDVRQVLVRAVERRIAAFLALVSILGVVVNLLVERLVTRPLARVVDSVRRVRAGHLGAQAPAPRTEELGYMADEFNAMSAALAEADHERRLEMDKARRIQEHLMPACAVIPGLKAFCTYEPASEVGGDYYDVRRREGAYLLCMADMTGHGVPAAMGAAVVKTLLVSAVDHSGRPAEILAEVNRGIAEILTDGDFASMVVTAFDPDRRRLDFASAGHPPAYLVRPGEPVRQLEATGVLLGVPGAKTWDTVTLEVRPGDRFLVVTDGLMETADAKGELFGDTRLGALVEETRGAPLDQMCRRILDTVKAFRGAAPQRDDITMMAVEF